MEFLFTGRWMEVDEALKWGLVNEVVAPGNLMTRAREIAGLLASGPPLVFAAIKEVVRETEGLPFQEALSLITNRKLPSIDILYGSEDVKEGPLAFAEKRAPVWKGK